MKQRPELLSRPFKFHDRSLGKTWTVNLTVMLIHVKYLIVTYVLTFLLFMSFHVSENFR